ncbi:MAG: 1-deoxy-D-xylulose-5-phosphate reductoisomerase [Ignavibacteria bacterium]|nr:1-deoxy-D-xylulose-5-phosphate reductoisomerase [Ignavibacteria bacterium]
MKKIVLLGSTGSIGVNTLEVVKNFPDKFSIEALSVNSNIELLKEQINLFSPKIVAVNDILKADELRSQIGNTCKILTGEDGLKEIAATCDYDIFVGAMVGFAGLAPTLEAIKRGKRIALANKETLVVAGEMVTHLIKEHNAELIPVDSEHSAIFQCLIGEKTKEVEKIILTASGGPFLHRSKDELKTVTIEDALNHPNWKMGSKITIDSATMMNKGLEVIEAYWLFGLSKNKFEVVIHPQSIIHSMVEFVDGSIKAQLSMPDMKLPIQFALTYPERLPANHVQTKFHVIKNLTFFEPDFYKFECLKLAYDVLEVGGTAPCILNASNEVAVEKFLNGKIGFTKIPYIISKSLEKIENHKHPAIDQIFECDKETRLFAGQLS